MAEKNKLNNLDDEDMFVTLDLDDGSSMECQILTIFEADGRDYIALLPVDEDEQPNEDGEVFIYRYSEDAEGNPSLENIEDDEEYAQDRPHKNTADLWACSLYRVNL